MTERLQVQESSRRFRAALPHELDGPLRLTDFPVYIERVEQLQAEVDSWKRIGMERNRMIVDAQLEAEALAEALERIAPIIGSDATWARVHDLLLRYRSRHPKETP